MSMKILPLILILGLTLSQATDASTPSGAKKGALLYSGLTPTGWQICLLDLESGKHRVLTASPGDKRRPFFLPKSGRVVCKDAAGRALGWSRGAETLLSEPIRSMGDLWFKPDGNSWYFTRLATDNPQRQFIWYHQAGDPDPESALVLRMEKGSLRQVALSPDGKFLAATHLWRVGEERILIIPVETPERYRYITPAMKTAFSPAWSADGKTLYFSMQQDGIASDFDLHRADLQGKAIQILKRLPGSSEWFPTGDAEERWVYFEENRLGISSLAALDLKTANVVSLSLPHQAREPHWISNPDTLNNP